jgi:hypothetical protein
MGQDSLVNLTMGWMAKVSIPGIGTVSLLSAISTPGLDPTQPLTQWTQWVWGELSLGINLTAQLNLVP